MDAIVLDVSLIAFLGLIISWIMLPGSNLTETVEQPVAHAA